MPKQDDAPEQTPEQPEQKQEHVQTKVTMRLLQFPYKLPEFLGDAEVREVDGHNYIKVNKSEVVKVLRAMHHFAVEPVWEGTICTRPFMGKPVRSPTHP